MRSFLLVTLIAPSLMLGAAVQAESGSWRKKSKQATLRNEAMEATFQSGLLCELKDLATGKVLLSADPKQMSASFPLFGPTERLNLDECTVKQEKTDDSLTVHIRGPEKVEWTTIWKIEPGKGDLVLQSSARSPSPVDQFHAVFYGCDITEYSVVGVDLYGVGHAYHAPWQGTFLGDPERDGSPGSAVGPLVALFQGKDSGWFIEGRDPRVGPAGALFGGRGNTATVGMARRFPFGTETPEMFEIRIRTYREHWEDAVDPYVAWLEQGAGFVPLDKKPQQWIKDIETQAYVNIGDYQTLEDLAKRGDPAKTFIGRQAEFRLYGFDEKFPDYQVSEFAQKWFQRARELGFHVGAHFNSKSLSVAFPDLVERFKPGFQETGVDKDGNVTYESIYEGDAKLIRVSAALKDWRDYLIEQIGHAVNAGVDIVYLDESMCSNGKYIVDGVDGIQGIMLLMKEIQDKYPGVAVQTEQFNLLTAKYGAFALSQMPLGHPLSGYIFQRYVKVVPEGAMYSPVDTMYMDAFDAWGYMLPGAAPDFRESWMEIAEAFQRFDLRPDGRLPRQSFTEFKEPRPGDPSSGLYPVESRPLPPEGLKLFGYRGKDGVTAYLEQHPTKRGLVVYEPGKDPQWFGARYSGLTSYPGPGLPVYYYFRHTVRDWLIYDGEKLMGLNPTETYWFDQTLKPSPERFHVTKIPDDFVGVIDLNKRVPPQEIGQGDGYFILNFAGNGEVKMHVPEEYDVYLDGKPVKVDRSAKTASVQVQAEKESSPAKSGPGYVIGNTVTQLSPTMENPSVLLAVKRKMNELTGTWITLPWEASPDSGRWVSANPAIQGFSTGVGGIGRIVGLLPQSKSLRLQGSYRMVDSLPGPPGDAVVRINGTEVFRTAMGERPYQTENFDVDISRFAGQHVLFEFVSDGPTGRNSAAEWISPRIAAE